jgi:hypothetical protein
MAATNTAFSNVPKGSLAAAQGSSTTTRSVRPNTSILRTPHKRSGDKEVAAQTQHGRCTKEEAHLQGAQTWRRRVGVHVHASTSSCSIQKQPWAGVWSYNPSTRTLQSTFLLAGMHTPLSAQCMQATPDLLIIPHAGQCHSHTGGPCKPQSIPTRFLYCALYCNIRSTCIVLHAPSTCSPTRRIARACAAVVGQAGCCKQDQRDTRGRPAKPTDCCRPSTQDNNVLQAY